MKKEKHIPTPENESIHQWQKRFTLGKRKEERERQKENAEQMRREIFRKKTSEASKKKAPYTLRTRAYYRFSKEYPTLVDENGFRANLPGKETVKRRRRITLAVCLLVFFLGFAVTKTAMYVSQRDIPKEPEQVTAAEKETFKALHFSYDELREGNVEKMLEGLKAAGCKAAVFELKDDKGYVMFNTGSFMGMSADRRIPDAADTVKALKTKGIVTCAYISCFKDSAASVSDLTYSVRKNSAGGDTWTDNSGMGWLNPFSQKAKDYLLDIISKASQEGFDRIILGNVCFSSDSGSASQYYEGEEGSTLTRNQILTGFIGNAVKSAGNAKLTVMGTYQAFTQDATANSPEYFGNLLTSPVVSLCIDARLSMQKKNITLDSDTFSDVSLMPFVFVLAASEYACSAVDNQKDNCETFICIEKGARLEEQLSAVEYSGADGYIIW